MGKTKNKKEEKEATEGSAVNVHYRGTLSDGTIFDSSYDRGEAISFTVGAGEMIPGFDAAINGMTIGEKKTINLTSEESYGPHNPDAIREVPKASFPDDFNFLEGHAVEGSAGGRPLRGTIKEVNDETVTIDFNHPMAGKDLNFEIELVGIES